MLVGDGEPDDRLWPALADGGLDLVDLLELMDRDGVEAVQPLAPSLHPSSALPLVQAAKQMPPSRRTGLSGAYDGRLLPGKLLVEWTS